jgi:hypothetical protein
MGGVHEYPGQAKEAWLGEQFQYAYAADRDICKMHKARNDRAHVHAPDGRPEVAVAVAGPWSGGDAIVAVDNPAVEQHTDGACTLYREGACLAQQKHLEFLQGYMC